MGTTLRPSSRACACARERTRCARSLTTEVWETINQTWLELHRQLQGNALSATPASFWNG